ncbi:MAG: radical SAM protein [Candidatus Eremiobacteraeota bacterium]|nr:radical SAM protein [Candidatus Eremiobacteraeota bacterium]
MRPVPLTKALLFKRTPVYVHYGVTHRCNLTCRMCGLWKTAKRSLELPLERIRKMARNFGSLGVSFISLGGGEPFMRDDLPMIIKAFMDEGITVRLLSNGIITDRKLLDEVLATGLRHVSISLDTSDAKMQAYICNRDDAWERASESLDFFGKHFARTGGLGIINTVVSKLNIGEIPAFVGLAEKYGFYCSFVPLEVHHYGGEALSCSEAQQDLNFSPDDHETIKETYRMLIAMKRKGKHIFNSTAFLERSRRYLLGEKPRWRCLAGMLYFSVSPEGFFSLCHRFKGYKEEPMEIAADSDEVLELFKSEEYFKACRKTIAACPGCLRPCWSEVSLVFTEASSFLEALVMQGRGRGRVNGTAKGSRGEVAHG